MLPYLGKATAEHADKNTQCDLQGMQFRTFPKQGWSSEGV